MQDGALPAVHHGQQASGGAQHDTLVHDAVLEPEVLVLDQPAPGLSSFLSASSAMPRARVPWLLGCGVSPVQFNVLADAERQTVRMLECHETGCPDCRGRADAAAVQALGRHQHARQAISQPAQPEYSCAETVSQGISSAYSLVLHQKARAGHALRIITDAAESAVPALLPVESCPCAAYTRYLNASP